MNLMQLPDAKRQVSEEKREQRTKHNRFQIIINNMRRRNQSLMRNKIKNMKSKGQER